MKRPDIILKLTATVERPGMRPFGWETSVYVDPDGVEAQEAIDDAFDSLKATIEKELV